MIVNGEAKAGFYVPNHQELKTVTWIMEKFVLYGSYQRLLEEMDRLGIMNKEGQPFKRATLFNLLTNRRYIGTWALNSKNKNINPKKLMPYERHTEVSLPHGEVIEIGLWNKVQQTVERISGSKSKNTKIKRVFLLSGLLKLQTDGSPFSGTGAWGKSKKRTDYYYNQTHKIRLSAGDLEAEAMRTVSQIIRGSKPFQDAIKQKVLATDSLKQFLDMQTRQLSAEISSLAERKQAAARRFDLLSVDASESDLKLYRDDYKNEMDVIRQESDQKEKAIENLLRQRDHLSDNEVETSTLIDRAQDTLGRIETKDPVALKNAYQELFEAIYVNLSPSEGSAELNFILKGHHSAVITEEEKDSFGDKMVGIFRQPAISVKCMISLKSAST